jgi:hypothetical protein
LGASHGRGGGARGCCRASQLCRGPGATRAGGDDLAPGRHTTACGLAPQSRRCWLGRVRSLGDHGVELSSLVIDGDVSQLWWWPLDLGWAEAEVVEDLLDRELVVDVGDDLERPPAPATDEGVGVIHLADQPGPLARAPRARLA